MMIDETPGFFVPWGKKNYYAMNISLKFLPYLKIYGLTLFSSMMILGLTGLIETSETQRFQAQEKSHTLNHLSTIRAKLEANVNSRILIVEGLSAYISTNPTINQEQFAAISAKILQRNQGITSITLAKNSIISHVYPFLTNKKALGTNLMAIPAQKSAVLRAIQNRKAVVAGPVKLVQGGIAFIHRNPIFSDEKYWGLVSILIDTKEVYKSSGILDNNSEFIYSLKGKDGLGEKGAVFWGNPVLFQQSPVTLSITLPNGTWILAGLPKNGWSNHSPLSVWIWSLGVISSIFVGGFMYIIMSEPERLKIAVNQATFDLKTAQNNLEFMNHILEDKVQKRTEQLQQANQEIILLNQQLTQENLHLNAEIDVAKKIQNMILPTTEELALIKDLEIAVFMQPAAQVGGDYYDILATDGVVTIGIGDVTGHGLESGLLMLMTQTSVRTLKEMKENNLINFLDVLNRTLYQNIQRMNTDKNLTLAILTYSKGELIISGQHEEILIVRNQGKIERVDTSDLGFPIGLESDIKDFINTVSITLNYGDGIVLYTDGITEAINPVNQMYGLERLCDKITEYWYHSAEMIKQLIIEDVYDYIAQQKVFDDLTLLVIKYHQN